MDLVAFIRTTYQEYRKRLHEVKLNILQLLPDSFFLLGGELNLRPFRKGFEVSSKELLKADHLFCDHGAPFTHGKMKAEREPFGQTQTPVHILRH